ncbi:MAG: hypothetical protein DI624_14015 [Brevundimonas sp.]|uniref:hypothetical protein n=1 Tax=Brevundimonas sp. TaxID=1871086 RepID=UPI000DB48070|nr:hypothetical protein [Brevundimonas sp.]PZT95264.1 MAG: hypothetical protein DI624_14015 [Brevundimonas sp.]
MIIKICTSFVIAATAIAAVGSVRAQASDALATIAVTGDPYYTLPHEIVIEPDTQQIGRTQQEVEGRTWRAVRSSEGRVDSITSDQCPALRNAALAFGSIARQALRAPSLAVASDPIPMGPTMKDGFSSAVTFTALQRDGARVELTAKGGAYTRWGHETVAALLECWAPLIPPPPADLTPLQLLSGLDLNSFRNSIGPSRTDGLKRPSNLGFGRVVNRDDGVALERPGDWIIGLRIIRWTPEGFIVCFADTALNGGSYNARSSLRLTNDGLGGFKAEEMLSPDPTCLPSPGQG